MATSTIDTDFKIDLDALELNEKIRAIIFWITVLVSQVMFYRYAYIEFWDTQIDVFQFKPGEYWTLGKTMALFQVFYTIQGFHQIGPTDLGARLLFGRPINHLRDGLVWIPPFLCQLKTASQLINQDELPADPEFIYRGKEDQVPEGFFPPIRIPFAPPIEGEEDDDPFNERVTEEVVPVLRWRIINYRIFLRTIGSMVEARRQMEDNSVSILLREFAQITLKVALKSLEHYQGILTSDIRKDVFPWGVALDSVKIKLIVLSPKLNASVQEIAEEKAKKRANEYKGQGEGKREKEQLAGRGEGMRKMAYQLQVDGASILGSETARGVTENPGQKTIVAGVSGFKELVGVAAAVGSVFTDEKPPESELLADEEEKPEGGER